MSERPTPETDAELFACPDMQLVVDADFARKLERERDDVRAEIAGLKAQNQYLAGQLQVSEPPPEI